MKTIKFCQAINAIEKHYGYHYNYIPLIGYNLMICTDQPSQMLENLVPIKGDQSFGPLGLMRYVLVNLESFICHDLSSQPKDLNQLCEYSSAVKDIDLRWIEKSVQKLNNIFQENQVNNDYIQAHVRIGQSGNFDEYIAIKGYVVNMFKHRFDLLVAPHNIQLSLANLGKILMFSAIIASGFDSMFENVQWDMGYAIQQPEEADQALANLPNYSLYEGYQQMGAFVHRKKEAIEFKQIIQQLLPFVKIEHVGYLLLFSMAFDHDLTRELQQQYQRVLTRKLSAHVEALEVETGDEALQKLEYMFGKFMAISARMASDINEDIENA